MAGTNERAGRPAAEERQHQWEASTGGGEPVSLTGLRKHFDDVIAVDGVSLEVEEGELLVLLGPSGCGKTTTLRMIAGLESISDGSVAIGGSDVSLTRPQERDVAMVFQNYALYPHKTVEENLRFPLPKTDIPEAEYDERVHATADLLGIADLLDKRPAALSGGQRQRVAIGRAIVREPSVLLMDEPLSNLDAKLRVKTRAELRELQQSLGLTSVYVTHDQEEAMSIADRIAIMNDGEVAQVGTPEEVYEDPDSAFVAEFLGDPPMNLLPAADGDGLAGTITDAAPRGAEQVGVRPEDCYLTEESENTDGGEPVDAPETLSAPCRTTVEVVEPIGRAVEVTLTTGEEEEVVVRARSVPESVEGGDQVAVAIDETAVYGFDRTGDRIQ